MATMHKMQTQGVGNCGAVGIMKPAYGIIRLQQPRLQSLERPWFPATALNMHPRHVVSSTSASKSGSGTCPSIDSAYTLGDLMEVVQDMQSTDVNTIIVIIRKCSKIALALDVQAVSHPDDRACVSLILSRLAAFGQAHTDACDISMAAGILGTCGLLADRQLLDNESLPPEMQRWALALLKHTQPMLQQLSPNQCMHLIKGAAVCCPGQISTDWLADFEMVSYKKLDQYNGDALGAIVWSLGKVCEAQSWSPNAVWVDHFVRLSRPKLVMFSGKALADTLFGLSQFNSRPPQDWLDTFQIMFNRHVEDFAPSDLANMLFGFAKLGIGIGGREGGRIADGLDALDFDTLTDGMDDFDMGDLGDIDPALLQAIQQQAEFPASMDSVRNLGSVAAKKDGKAAPDFIDVDFEQRP